MKAKNSRKNSGTNWERLSTKSNDEIDFSDIPELDENFFANAILRLPEPKKTVSIRLDSDVLDWYKKQGPGYQTRMNAILRMYMKSKNLAGRKTSTKQRIQKTPSKKQTSK
jgi:uncharacterized protein (DUF4415 family)